MGNQMKNSILIVDDDKANILYLKDIFYEDYRIYTAKDGLKAIQLAEEYLPDLILLDIVMRGLNGYEVLAKLKASEKTKDIPVIFITGLSGTDDETKGLSLGAEDYIAKPFNNEVVRLRVRNQLKIVNQMRTIVARELSERSARAKSEFLSRMSHEMRTPMNAIMGMTVLARMEGGVDTIQGHLKKIDNASRELLQFIDGILDIADIKDGKMSMSCSEYNVADVVRQVIERVEETAKQKNQSLSFDISEEIPETIYGDKSKLSQVLSILLSNAVKFTGDRGAILIKAAATEFKNETISLQLEVIDNGIGIDKEHQKVLFELFEQADGGADRKFGGVGSGLFKAKHIIEMMGGKIWVRSEPSKGSNFTFTVGMRTSPPTPQSPCGHAADFTGKTILLVDDIEINREIVMLMLKDTGVGIYCAESGTEAVKMFSAEEGIYDLILMDIHMPEMDGIEATINIRNMKGGQNIPIIAITADVLASNVENYLKAGMNGHIGKPVDFERLISTLEKYL